LSTTFAAGPAVAVEADIPILLIADLCAVQIDLGVVIDPVELDDYFLPRKTLGQGEVLTVPPERPGIGGRRVRGFVEGNAHIVGNIRRCPRSVVKGCGLRPGDVSGLHLPALIDPKFDSALEKSAFKTLGQVRIGNTGHEKKQYSSN
jgi:hypothetical protein